MNAPPGRGYLGIGEVLAQLRDEFPDVSVSKIRFLETEGLITPARSPSGYRRFGGADVDRLRFILAAQRDQYLPLRVIRERLADTEPSDGDRLLSRRELLAEAGLSEALLTELETFGLLRRVGRSYGPNALQVAKAAVALTAYGVEARHLRSVRAAVERETTMIESLVAPILRQRASGARELAARTAGELADLVLQLHSALVAETLAEAGLSLAEVFSLPSSGGAGAVPEPRPAATAGWQDAIGGVL
jgi:DNA-binding transcriptional MerR regulator